MLFGCLFIHPFLLLFRCLVSLLPFWFDRWNKTIYLPISNLNRRLKPTIRTTSTHNAKLRQNFCKYAPIAEHQKFSDEVDGHIGTNEAYWGICSHSQDSGARSPTKIFKWCWTNAGWQQSRENWGKRYCIFSLGPFKPSYNSKPGQESKEEASDCW